MKTPGFLGVSVLLATGIRVPAEVEDRTTVGLYGNRNVQDQYAFWRACGVNLLQFCDTGALYRADTLENYYAEFAREIETAQQAGFRVYVLLLSNIRQWQGPEESGPDMGLRYYPRDWEAMQERLDYLAQAIRALRHADGFTFFAGDPGGVPKALGPSTVQDWMAMARQVREVVQREAPDAEFNVNPWAVVQWEDEGMNVFGSEFWLKEAAFTRTILREEGFLGPGCGVEFPAHNSYRSLTLRIFRAAGIPPEPCPTAEEVRTLRARGIERLWAWPYFLLDEVDDGYIGSVWKTYGQAQAETRYLHRLAGELRRLGCNGVIGNHGDTHSCRAEALNVYAFTRFGRDPAATPAGVIDEFAGHVADEATQDALAQVLRFIENHSSWQASLPPEDRLEDFDCGDLASAAEALRRLNQVTSRTHPTFPLPEPPADYLQRLRQRLEVLAALEGPPEAALAAQADALFAPLKAR